MKKLDQRISQKYVLFDSVPKPSCLRNSAEEFHLPDFEKLTKFLPEEETG